MTALQSILIVLTSFGEIAPGEPTGIWLEEFTVPYQEFKNAGLKVTVASIKGGEVPIDPRSKPSAEQLQDWSESIQLLKNTQALNKVDGNQFDAIFLPGGHGTMFDFPDDPSLNQLLGNFADHNKVIAAVCHGPAGLVNATLSDGSSIVAGKQVTGFTNDEELETGLAKKMPFLLESRLHSLGATFVAKPKWSDHVQIDGKLITGQNPQSSQSTAKAVLRVLADR